MKILIIAESGNPSTDAVYSAAKLIADSVDVAHVTNLVAEQFAPAVAAIATNYTHILTAATSFGKDCMPRIAALIDAPQLSDVVEIVDHHTFKRPIYAGNAIETVQVSAPIICMTIRQSAFATSTAPQANITIVASETNTKIIATEATKTERPALDAASIVVSGGRGVGSKEGFIKVEALADKLGAAVGASRAAVDAGYAPNDYQVGQTGKIVAPELYIAIGISGAIQHIAGMKESKVIVAINKDANAPIFEYADIGLVADLHAVIPELLQLI